MIDPKKILSSSQLPTLPTVAVRLLEISKDPETEIKDIICVIKTDPAISAKILKSTNSSFFGFSSEVTSIERAVPLLGTTVVTSLALSFSLVDAAMSNGPLAEHYRKYWLQSVVQGVTAELLTEFSSKGLECEYFLTGLLMDLGRLAMLKAIPNDYLPVLEAVEEQQRDLHLLEVEMLGFDHVKIGMGLIENWKLPESLIHAVQFHHAPVDALKNVTDGDDTELIHAISVAAAVGDYYCAAGKGRALDRLKSLTSTFYGFSETQLEEFLAKTKKRIDDAGDMFSVNTDELGDPSDLMAEASEQLANLAMREHAATTQAVARQQAVELEKQQLETQNQKLQKQAIHDPLTEIYNRNFFDESLEKELSRCARTATPLAIIFSDIDRFKNLNDTYGHQFGDIVLRRVARLIEQTLRKSDVLARFGGEEFVVLLHQPTEKGTAKVAERIREQIESEEIFYEETRVPVTISIGSSFSIPRRNETDLGERLIAAADEAMYKSKQNGRNQVHNTSMLDEQGRRILQRVTAQRFSRWIVTRKVLDIPTISKVLLQCQTPKVQIGQLAKQHDFLGDSQIEQILGEQRQDAQRFGAIAIRLGLLNEDQLVWLLTLQQESPEVISQGLVSQGLLEHDYANALLQEFKNATAPTPTATSEQPKVS